MSITCLRCDGLMEIGYTIDTDLSVNVCTASSWYPDELKTTYKALFTGKAYDVDRIKQSSLDQSKIRPITTYRCKECGYLESYAN